MKDETKSEKFKRVAGNRTNKILDLIRILGNCSNTSIYEYSQEDVNKIFSAIETVISEKMEWPFRNSGMLFRNKRNEESFWSKARPFKSYSEASFC